MSNTTSTGGSTSQGTFRTAQEAVGSAAEQVRAAAPAAYDAGAKAARYVGSTASEYPLTTLLVTAGLAYLAGVLSNSSRGGWQNWQDSANAIRQQVRSAAPSMSEAASYSSDYVTRSAKDAGNYVTQGVREYPISVLLGTAVVSGLLGYLLQGRGE
jgi:ElaB/YqjD/DUF883 family membrane-anchored ribosome-binding protein